MLVLVSSASNTSGNTTNIFELVTINTSSLRQNEYLTDYETVTANPEIFLDDVSDGDINMEILGQHFHLELNETFIVSKDAVTIEKIRTYRGKVVDVDDSRASFTVSETILIGSIEVNDTQYVMSSTNKTKDGKVVIVVYSSDWIKSYPSSGEEYVDIEKNVLYELTPSELLDYRSRVMSSASNHVKTLRNAEENNVFASSIVTVDISGEADYTSIQAVVDNATEGDIILIYPGSYLENIDVDKELTILSTAEDPADTIVEAKNTQDNVFYVTANNVTISGFTIKGAIYDEYGDDKAGIWLNDVTGCQIIGNNLTNNIGIFLVNSNGNKILDNIVFKCSLYGIWLQESSYNELFDNRVTRGNQPGILLYTGCNNNVLVNNTVTLNYGGISLYNCANNVLSYNNASNNKNIYGFSIYGSNSKVNNNIANSNKGTGFLVRGNNNILDYNVAKSNTENGLMISGTGNTVKNNTAISNANENINHSDTKKDIATDSEKKTPFPGLFFTGIILLIAFFIEKKF